MPIGPACLLALSLIVPPCLDAAEPAQITVRFLPTKDTKKLQRLLDRLATIGQPELVRLQANESIDQALILRCGSARAELLASVRSANPDGEADLIAQARTVKFPPCPYWSEQGSVTITKDESLDQQLKLNVGVSGPTTVEQVRALNAETGAWEERLQPGKVLKLPYVTRPVTITLQDVNADPLVVKGALANEFPKLVPAELNERYFQQEAQFRLVAETTFAAAAPSPATPDCSPVPEDSWPFNAEQVSTLLARYLTNPPSRTASILIADSGLNEADADGLTQLKLLWRNESETALSARTGYDDGNNGIDDDIYGASMSPPVGDPSADDGYEFADHGTQVASAAAGSLRSPALNGVLSNRLQIAAASLVKYESLQSPEGPPTERRYIPASAVLDSLAYARRTGFNVLNWSIESDEKYLALLDSLHAAKALLVVVAAGNRKRNVDLDEEQSYPVSYHREEADHIISVGAHDRCLNPSSFTNFGSVVVDLLAPGDDIDTMLRGGGRKRDSGTSFAAPQVSFTAAVLSMLGVREAARIRERILDSVDVDPGLADKVASHGRLNVLKALAIYDDVIVVPGTEQGRHEVLIGRIEPAKLTVCGETISIREKLVRLVPNFDPESNRPSLVKILRTRNTVDAKNCKKPQGRFTFEPADGSGSREYDVGQVEDILPAMHF